ncbi:peptidoglycan-binding domain-containing protein [Streptomyces sp. NPDC048643]|uniref:peptidoglycan-binding domain-containing protein n=1 Tax=Streptomyces sp. NPDC048643 TaxID=3155637 RepID=UPI003421D258
MPTPAERGRSTGRSAIEPTHIQRRRRTEALAELVRQVREDDEGRDADEGYESVPLPARRTLPPSEDDDTEELAAVPAARSRTRGRIRPRTALAVGVTAAALTGIALALLLSGVYEDDASRAGAGARSSTAPAGRAASDAADPDGAGTLRQGDSGPEVSALQQRLLRIPNVYDHGSTDGTFDAPLADAVARFQLWYGIRGDESGVYGDDTRADLESRTTLR